MAKDLSRGNVPPTPLDVTAIGVPKVDAALAKLQAFHGSPHSPVLTQYDPEHEKAAKIAAAAGEKLVPLLSAAAAQAGTSSYDDDWVDKLRGADGRAFKKLYNQVLEASRDREIYLYWLASSVVGTKAGLARAIEIVAGEGSTAGRNAVAKVLRKVDDAAACRAIAAGVDPHDYDGKDQQLARAFSVGVYAQNLVDPKQAYDRYQDLFDLAKVKKLPGSHRAQAVFSGLSHAEQVDARWVARSLPLLQTHDHDNSTLMLLEQMPPDPAVIEPILAYLGGDPEKVGYWNDNAVKILGRVANARVLPFLVGALRSGATHWPAAFEGFRKAGDPAMAHVIREWLVEHGGGPKDDQTREGNAIIKELEKHGRAPAPAGPSLAIPVPVKTRPVLKYVKARKFNRPKIGTLAAEQKDLEAAFAEAALEDVAAMLIVRAVFLIPTRVDESELGVGATKLGGHPDLDAKTEWPRIAKAPLTFLAQIDLASVAAHVPRGVLPAAGLLSFFVGEDVEGPLGYLEKARVLYTPPKAKLARKQVPDDYTGTIYQAARVEAVPGVKVPSETNPRVRKLLEGDRLAAYGQVTVGVPPVPQLLGCWDHGYDAEVPARARLLLQLPGDNQTDMEFGDDDVLGLFIDEKQLAKADFSKVWPKLGD